MKHSAKPFMAGNPKTVAPLLGQVLVVSVIAVLLLSLAASCSKPPPPFTEIAEPPYARTILEKMLASWNENNYDAYLEYQHPTMLLPDSKMLFDARVTRVKANFGDYVADSAQFSDASFQYNNTTRLGYTVVYYHATFTNQPRRVLVEITFRDIDGKVYVDRIGLNVRSQGFTNDK